VCVCVCVCAREEEGECAFQVHISRRFGRFRRMSTLRWASRASRVSKVFGKESIEGLTCTKAKRKEEGERAFNAYLNTP
jgi:hypothetical protein